MRSAVAYAVAGSVLAMMSARSAEQPPAINGAAYCATTAELVDDEAFKQQCLDSEAKAENHVRALWAETPDSVRTTCAKELLLVTPSYQALSTCMSTMIGDLWMAGELKVLPR